MKGGLLIGLVFALLVIVGGTAGYMTNWWGLVPDETAPTGGNYVPPDKTGDLGSLKYAVRTISDATPAQYAGTGYCWDVAAPTQLLESSSGKTLSSTAGTSFANAYRGHTYVCDSWASTHFCNPAQGAMGNEGLNLRSDCYNLTSSTEVKMTLYENDVAETAASESLTVQAGNYKYFNKFMLEVNKSYRAIPVKAICFKSNVSSTHVQKIEVANWNRDEAPSGAYSDCYSLATAKIIDNSYIFPDAIKVYSDSTGFAAHELITWTLMDEGNYVGTDGAVYADYFERKTASRGDVGMTNPSGTFKLVS